METDNIQKIELTMDKDGCMDITTENLTYGEALGLLAYAQYILSSQMEETNDKASND